MTLNNKLKIGCLIFILVLGCSPKINWRVVVNSELNYSATFPDKPIQMTRRIQLNEQALELTLQAAKIDNVLFAVGVGSLEHIDKAQQGTMVKSLVMQMASNIQVDQPVIQEKIFLGKNVFFVDERGHLPQGEPGRLIGYFFAESNRVYEVIVIGPANLFTESLQREWFSGFSLFKHE